MGSQLRPAFVSVILFSLLTGVLYPLCVTGFAQAVFPHQANGSLMVTEGITIGSELIGQPFNDPRYFWSRPSATSLFPYNAAASSGSNLGPTNPDLAQAVRDRIAELHASDPKNTLPIPVDLVTASASGLDPHISIAAANYQVARVAKARDLDEAIVNQLIHKYTEGRQFGILGEPRVNVLRLNLALDKLQ
jgi:K+-transporting ATPase KdpC subunit